MTEEIVHFTHAVATDAGAVPVGTHVGTHTRASDGAEVQDVYIDPQTVLALPTGAATSANQTNGAQLSRIVDADGHQVNVQAVTSQISGDEYGVVTNAIVHGLDSQGHWHDVKVTHSGELTTSSTIAGIDDSVVFETTRADDLYNDAFQRLRVSDTDQRFDGEFDYDKLPLLFDDISTGGGTVTFDGNARDVVIATGATGTGVSAGLRQRWANIYTRGNSQFIVLTGTLNSANIAGGEAQVFLRSKVTGTVTEEVIPQSAWAVTSGVNWHASQIFIMDFQSLRVGRIRFGIDRSGIAVPLAQIANDNKRDTGYWQTANQPVYFRQYNTALYTYTEIGYGDENNAIGFRYRVPVTAAQTMTAICATVKSEGGGDLSDLTGARFTASNGVTKRNVTSTTVFLPVLSIQVKSTLNTYPVKAIVFPRDFEISNDNPVYYEWRVNGTLTGAVFTSVDANSITNYDVTATGITGGRVIRSGYAGTGGSSSRNVSGGGLTSKIPLGVNAAGVGDILTLCMVKDGVSNSAVGASLNFEDIR